MHRSHNKRHWYELDWVRGVFRAVGVGSSASSRERHRDWSPSASIVVAVVVVVDVVVVVVVVVVDVDVRYSHSIRLLSVIRSLVCPTVTTWLVAPVTEVLQDNNDETWQLKQVARMDGGWSRVLRRTRHKRGHFGDVTSCSECFAPSDEKGWPGRL